MAKSSLDLFRSLRVYERLSVGMLLNDMVCNRIMKINFVVNRAPSIYNLATKVFGNNFINTILNATYCKIFTAGNSIAEANELSQYFRKQGIFTIIKVYL